MLDLLKPKKCKAIFGFIYASEDIYQKTKKNILKKYGNMDFESGPLEFNFTEYYQEETGTNLKRRFISLKNLINPDQIKDIKIAMIKLENKYAILKKRRINIDPGYINEAKLVLSTTKDFSHRIYLSDKIFAEVTLLYANKAFRNLPWTFPAYRTKSYKKIFLTIRDLYKEQIRKTYN